MRLFIIGSLVKAEGAVPNSFQLFCRSLGHAIASRPINLILCSPFQNSADKAIVDGLKQDGAKKCSLEIHYPRTTEIDIAWSNLLINLPKNISISKFWHEAPNPSDANAINYSWLFCQIQAIINCNAVLVIGGNVGGSSNLLVRVAEAQGKEIIPLPKFGGVGELYFERKKYQLADRWLKENVDVFYQCTDSKKIIDIIAHPPQSQTNKTLLESKEQLSFFLSYPREKPAEADFIEMILRRRNHIVIRDEVEIKPADDIPNAIIENIKKADVFIAIWCREYACSPWCFDELQFALESHHKEDNTLWIFRVDNTRMIPPNARKLLWYEASTRAELEGQLIKLIS